MRRNKCEIAVGTMLYQDENDGIQAGHEALLDKICPDMFVTGPRSPNQHIGRFLKPRGIPMQIIDANDFTTTKLLERIHAKV